MSKYELALLRADGEPQLFPIEAESAFIGRSKNMDIPVEGSTVSRRHVRLWEEEGLLAAEDLSSRNGIVVNGERVRNAKLKAGDLLMVGQNCFYVHDTTQPKPSEWPKPAEAAQAPTRAARPEAAATEFDNGNGVTWSSDDSAWFRYVHDADKLQKKLAKAALVAAGGQRAYVLTMGSGASRYRVLAAHTESGNPDGPRIDETIVDRVLRKKAPMAVEGGTGAMETGVVCVPMVGSDRCVGALYVDGGLREASFGPQEVDRLVGLGRTAGRVLQAAAQLKSVVADSRREAVQSFARAVLTELNATDAAERLDRLRNNLDVFAESMPHDSTLMDANLVIEPVVDEMKEAAESKGVRIDFPRGKRALVYADDRDLACALSNLLRYAIASSERGTAITVCAENRIDGCYIEVQYPGGEDSEALRAALSPGKDAFEAGLGTAAAKAALERSGGALRFKPGPSESVTLSAVLPQQEAAK